MQSASNAVRRQEAANIHFSHRMYLWSWPPPTCSKCHWWCSSEKRHQLCNCSDSGSSTRYKHTSFCVTQTIGIAMGLCRRHHQVYHHHRHQQQQQQAGINTTVTDWQRDVSGLMSTSSCHVLRLFTTTPVTVSVFKVKLKELMRVQTRLTTHADVTAYLIHVHLFEFPIEAFPAAVHTS